MSNAGPSRPTQAYNGKKPYKTIEKTVDLIKQNARAKGNGKGKEKQVLGDLSGLIAATKNLPDIVDVERFAETRALEILALRNAIKSAAAQGGARVFQSLPRHLRRRAASHNPRRVPKRLRSRAAAEIDEGDNIAKIHRKRAKLRAKGNLRGESRTEQLIKRQRDKTWLPTHIYHAKRFHMTNLWSHRLALTPTLKSFRPAYRAARRRAVVHDTSYFGTIELEGEREEVLALLGRMTVGQRFAGDRYENGARLANIILYHFDRYPNNLIGPAEIIWQPPTSLTNTEKRLWIRLHPSIYEEAWDALKASIKRCPKIVNLNMRDLRGELDSFELTGPQAGDILKRVLRVCRSEDEGKKQFLRDLENPAEVSEGMIVGLQVYDPRLHFPPALQPESIIAASSDEVVRSQMQSEPSSSLATSSIWDSNIRDSLSSPKYKKSDLDRRRQQLGLPGIKLRPLAQDDRIPLLLIQRTLSASSVTVGAGSELMHGFTLVFPRGWSMHFLQSFVFARALIGGLEERRNQFREAGLPCFPEFWGDVCKAGRELAEGKGDEERRRWKRKPPGKRAEYGLLGSKWAFKVNWAEVMSLGRDDGDIPMTAEENFINGNQLIQPWLLSSPLISYIPSMTVSPSPAQRLFDLINAFRTQRALPSPHDSPSAMDLYTTALVQVRVEVLGRGSPKDMAYIYSLSLEDRGKWLEADRAKKEFGRAGWNSFLADEEMISEVQRLGEEVPKIEDVIGFTTTGNFSFSRGRGHALANVTLAGYVDLMKTAKEGWEEVKDWAVVKVRNRDGRICRLAKLELV